MVKQLNVQMNITFWQYYSSKNEQFDSMDSRRSYSQNKDAQGF